MGFICKYLVLKDPPRNRSMAGKYGVLWEGMKVHIIYGSIYQLIVEGKWANARIIIEKWLQRLV